MSRSLSVLFVRLQHGGCIIKQGAEAYILYAYFSLKHARMSSK